MENNGSLEKYVLQPIDFDETNSWLEGRDLHDNEKNYANEIKGIRCFKDGGVVVTRWHLKNFWSRLKFLFTGEINIIVIGPTQPPMAVRIDSPFFKIEHEKQN